MSPWKKLIIVTLSILTVFGILTFIGVRNYKEEKAKNLQLQKEAEEREEQEENLKQDITPKPTKEAPKESPEEPKEISDKEEKKDIKKEEKDTKKQKSKKKQAEEIQKNLPDKVVFDFTEENKESIKDGESREVTFYYVYKNIVSAMRYDDDGFCTTHLRDPEDIEPRIVDYEGYIKAWNYYTSGESPVFSDKDKNYVIQASLGYNRILDYEVISIIENKNDLYISLKRTPKEQVKKGNGFLLIIPVEKTVENIYTEYIP